MKVVELVIDANAVQLLVVSDSHAVVKKKQTSGLLMNKQACGNGTIILERKNHADTH
jgi:hypothetical protein